MNNAKPHKPTKILIICPYFFEPHRWMISAYKTAFYLSKSQKVVVLTTGRLRVEKINDNLTVYRMWDLFLPDPINYSLVPGLLFSLILVMIKEKPTHFIVNKYMFFTSFSVPLLRLMGKKVVTVTDTFPGINWFPRRAWVAFVMRIYAYLIGLPILWLSNKVVILHEGLIDVARRYRLNYTVIHNGVDLEAIDATPADTATIDQKYINIFYAGRLESVKGYTDIVSVAEKMTSKNLKLRFILAGDTANKQAYVKRHSSKQIIFLGHRTDVISLMKASSIFLLASYSEGLPNVVMEAFACHLPCVASAVGGVKTLIENEKNGLTFTAGDRLEMEQQLQKLIDNRQLCDTLSKKARKQIEQKYSWATIAQDYLNLLKSI